VERDEPISYIIAARLYKPVQMKVAGQKTWFVVDNVIKIGETGYSGAEGRKVRTMVIIRQYIGRVTKAAGKKLRLFQDSDIHNNYRYECFITNMKLPAQQVWKFYRHWADAENRIKELKSDFGFDSFNIQSFYGS
jgi:hypothetical protein